MKGLNGLEGSLVFQENEVLVKIRTSEKTSFINKLRFLFENHSITLRLGKESDSTKELYLFLHEMFSAGGMARKAKKKVIHK